jgi:hypothetical protein
MTCEALVIGSLAGLALTGTVLFLQVLTDKKKLARRKVPREEEMGRRYTLTTATITN